MRTCENMIEVASKHVQVTGQYATCGSALAHAPLLEGLARTAMSSTVRCFSAVAELAMDPPHQVIATTPEVRFGTPQSAWQLGMDAAGVAMAGGSVSEGHR